MPRFKIEFPKTKLRPSDLPLHVTGRVPLKGEAVAIGEYLFHVSEVETSIPDVGPTLTETDAPLSYTVYLQIRYGR